MEVMIWIGALASLTGVAGLIWCIVIVARAKRENLSEDDLRARLKSVLPLNLGALLLSAIGLMLVVVGILLS